ncbi:hypothetical protein [Vogesella indigofera]|uniref:hypothetical protein n=1 Tax=Vogesella indigofera TaxID=45465 RepID=UPI00234E7312|nr:hypothetical protein [Vogesella indigofera]MDC7707720.1 hypothetical protein [Vogesella indigofera]
MAESLLFCFVGLICGDHFWRAGLVVVLRHFDFLSRPTLAARCVVDQRPSDVLKLKRTDIREGTLFIRQRKTSTALRVQIDGPLFDVLARISTNMALQAGAVKSLYLVQTEDGQPLSYRGFESLPLRQTNI